MVTVDELKTALNRFAALIHEQSDVVKKVSFRDQLKTAYSQRILGDLSTLFKNHGNDQPKLRSVLIDYLKSNETLIHGSALYYTCTPQEPATKMLYLIAVWVSGTSPEDTPVSAVSVLMSGLGFISNDSDSSQEKPPYRASLLKELNVEFSIETRQDFDEFMKMSVEDMDEFGKIKSIRDALANIFIIGTDFVDFIIATPEIKLQRYFTMVKDHYLLPLVTSIDKIQAMFLQIPANKLRVLLDSAYIERRVRLAMALGRVSPPLSAGQRKAVFESIKNNLHDFIDTESYLIEALTSLTPAEIREVFEWPDNQKILKISKKDFSLVQVLRHLDPERRSVLCSVLQEKGMLPRIIRSSAGLNNSPYAIVFASSPGDMLSNITSASHFKEALSYLDPELRPLMYEQLKCKLPRFIKSASDLGLVSKYLTPDQLKELGVSIKVNLSTIIKSGSDLGNVLQYLCPAKCFVLCDLLKEQLPGLIRCGSDLVNVLKYLSPSQSKSIIQSLEEGRFIFGINLCLSAGFNNLHSETITALNALIKKNVSRDMSASHGFFSQEKAKENHNCSPSISSSARDEGASLGSNNSQK